MAEGQQPQKRSRGRPPGSKNKLKRPHGRPPKIPTEAQHVPVNPTPKTPTFAEALEAFAATKPAPPDVSAATRWYEENLDACLKARETHPNVTYKEMYAIAQQSGLPPEVSRSQFQTKVSVALTKQRRNQRWASDQRWSDIVNVDTERLGKMVEQELHGADVSVSTSGEAERTLMRLL